jgi:hypothetical protein
MFDLSRLEVGAVIGSGGQGVVRAARSGATQLAVKVLAPASAEAASFMLGRLAHFTADLFGGPTLPVFAQGRVDGAPASFAAQLQPVGRDALFLVMPLTVHGSLADAARDRPLTELEASAALALVAEALSRFPPGVGHGDLRLENVLLRPGGLVTLIDPDLTREPTSDDDLRAIGAMARSLAGEGQGTGGRKLRQLASELEIPGHLPSLGEVRRRLVELAVELGGRADDLGAALASRVRAVVAPVTVASAPLPARPRSAAAVWIASGLAVAVVTAVALYLSPREPPPGIEPVAGAIFDTTGTVHHGGKLHALRCGYDLADAKRAFIQVTIAAPVKSVALAPSGGDPLWKKASPNKGDVYCFDAPAGAYDFVQERVLADGRAQNDPKPVMAEATNPLRLMTTWVAMFAPTGERDGGVTTK